MSARAFGFIIPTGLVFFFSFGLCQLFSPFCTLEVLEVLSSTCTDSASRATWHPVSEAHNRPALFPAQQLLAEYLGFRASVAPRAGTLWCVLVVPFSGAGLLLLALCLVTFLIAHLPGRAARTETEPCAS